MVCYTLCKFMEPHNQCQCQQLLDHAAEHYPNRELPPILQHENLLRHKLRCELIEQEEVKRLREEVRQELKMKEYLLITISLPISMEINEITKKMEKLKNNKPFQDWLIYTYEFTGKQMKYHPHIHVIISKKQNLKRYITNVSNTFKIKTNFVDIQAVANHELQDKFDYIKGEKKQAKMQQVEEDQKIRKKNNLNDYYINAEKVPND